MRCSTLVLCLTLPLWAQQTVPFQPSPNPANQSPANKPKHTITGSVVNSVTGDVVSHALVRVETRPEPLFGFTGPDGRFSIDAVPEGRWAITAERPGFVNPRQNFRPGSSPMQSSYSVGSGSNDFKIELTPESSVTGVVTDSDGNPIEQLQVQVFENYMNQGRKQQMFRGSAATDDTGTYRIDGLAPDSVLLHTMSRPVVGNTVDVVAGRLNGGFTQAYPETYYPNTTDASSAQPIELKPGQEARADFNIAAAPVYSVTGTISGLPPNSHPMVQMIRGTSDSNMYRPVQYDGRTGQFSIRMLPAGASTLRFTSNDGQGHLFEAIQQINIDGANVTGLQIAFQPGNEIPVQVNAPATNSAPPNLPNGQPGLNNMVQVQLTPVSGGNRGYFSGAVPANSAAAADSPKTIKGVLPDQYRVTVHAFGSMCVDSASYGGTDLLRNPLVVESGAAAQPLVINLRNDCATLSVTVHLPDGAPPSSVLLTSSSPIFQPQTFQTQTEGSLTVSNLSPGSYRVYALTDVSNLEYTNPNAMRGISGQDVDLQAGQKASITLELVDRSEKQ